MITDQDTNYLYLADMLPKKYPFFYRQFEKVLADCNIEFSLLPHTKDIWAVDYMPIQVGQNEFIQFDYNPDYLQSKKWLKTIPDVDSISATVGIEPKKSPIVLDGGNVIRSTNKVILSNKVFYENLHIPELQLIKELEILFQVDQLIFIPTQPQDFTGHADGMVRFLDEDSVLVNNYSQEKLEFQLTFRMALHNAGLKWVEIPYNPYSNKKQAHANGIYMNFLQMENIVIIPTFGLKEDELAVKQFENLFPEQKIQTVDSNEIAYQGGILNCISWNIKRSRSRAGN